MRLWRVPLNALKRASLRTSVCTHITHTGLDQAASRCSVTQKHPGALLIIFNMHHLRGVISNLLLLQVRKTKVHGGSDLEELTNFPR